MPSAYRAGFGLLVAVLTVATIFVQVLGVTQLRFVTHAAALCVIAYALPTLGTLGRMTLVITIALVAIAAALGVTSFDVLVRTGDMTAFMGAFFAVLGCLRSASGRSPAMQRCGEMLVSRPPGQRYVALTFGSLLFSTVLNFGSLPLLGAMAHEANNCLGDPQSPSSRRRERRMLMALLRGFSGFLLTSPTAFSVAVVLAAVPGTVWWLLLPVSALTTLILLAAGWAFDRWSALRDPEELPAGGNDQPQGFGAVLAPLSVFVIIFVSAAAIAFGLETTLAEGVMFVLPPISFAWFLLQAPAGGLRRLRTAGGFAAVVVGEEFFKIRQEVCFVMLLGASSTLLAALVSTCASGGLVEVEQRPALFIGIVMAVVIGSAAIGLNPMVSVTVLGGVLPAPADIGLAPTALALTLLVSWALAGAVCPGVAAVNLVASIGRSSTATVAYRWNGPFTLAAAAGLYVYLVVMNLLLR